MLYNSDDSSPKARPINSFFVMKAISRKNNASNPLPQKKFSLSKIPNQVDWKLEKNLSFAKETNLTSEIELIPELSILHIDLREPKRFEAEAHA